MAIRLTSVQELLEVFGEEFVRDLGNSLDNRKDATGKLRESIHFQIKIFSKNYEFQLLLEDYYKWVDEGRKPGTKRSSLPPFSAIMKWISRKPRLKDLLTVTHFKKKGKRLKKTGVSTNIQKQRNLAFAIRESIYKKGIKPTYFFSNVFEDGRVEKLKINLGKALKKDVLVEIREIAKEI